MYIKCNHRTHVTYLGYKLRVTTNRYNMTMMMMMMMTMTEFNRRLWSRLDIVALHATYTLCSYIRLILYYVRCCVVGSTYSTVLLYKVSTTHVMYLNIIIEVTLMTLGVRSKTDLQNAIWNASLIRNMLRWGFFFIHLGGFMTKSHEQK